jgi:hypothetical protein
MRPVPSLQRRIVRCSPRAVVVKAIALVVIATWRGRALLLTICCGAVCRWFAPWWAKAVVLGRLHRRHLGRLIAR